MFNPARSQIAHLMNVLPCGAADLRYANDRRAFEDEIERTHGGQTTFEARRGVSFENALACLDSEQVAISVNACTGGRAQFSHRQKRTLVMYLAGSGRESGAERTYDLTSGGEALIASPELCVAECGLAAHLIVTFDPAALEDVTHSVSGLEGVNGPTGDLLVPSEIMLRNGWRDVLIGATRTAFIACGRQGFVSQAAASDLMLRTIAMMSLDALSLRERESTASDGARAAAKARAYMLARLGEDITLSELERVGGVSGRTLQTHFRRAYGASPMRYLREERLKAARDMLLAGKSTVTEAALACGFTHMSQFSALFRERFGLRPSEIARRGPQA